MQGTFPGNGFAQLRREVDFSHRRVRSCKFGRSFEHAMTKDRPSKIAHIAVKANPPRLILPYKLRLDVGIDNKGDGIPAGNHHVRINTAECSLRYCSSCVECYTRQWVTLFTSSRYWFAYCFSLDKHTVRHRLQCCMHIAPHWCTCK